jgi:quinol monooxygenase YgiN
MKEKLSRVLLAAAVALAFGCAKKDEKKSDETPPPAAKKVAPKKETTKVEPPKADASGSHKGKVLLTLIFTAKPDQVAEGEKLFESHAKWMAESHHKDGKLALLRYNVAKGAVKAEALNPASKDTKDTHFVLTEVYESAEGIADHWKQGAEGWGDFKNFVAWAGKTKVTAMHGGEVLHSLWDKPSPNHKGKTLLTLVFKAKGDQIAAGEKLFESHAKWMAESHHKDGNLALHRYNVAKAPAKEEALNPASKDTDEVLFVLSEVYESPEGIADHWKQGSEGWADFKNFVDWAGKTEVTAMHGAPVMHSLW